MRVQSGREVVSKTAKKYVSLLVVLEKRLSLTMYTYLVLFLLDTHV